jgi:hypothetical protein
MRRQRDRLSSSNDLATPIHQPGPQSTRFSIMAGSAPFPVSRLD